jgi:type II secretory pathway pseudopilin PulG
MKRQVLICAVAILALLCAGLQPGARAQVFDFGQIEEFESLGSGTQTGGSPPKTIVDDNQRHTVLFTVLESNTEAKIYWKSKDGSQTTTIRGQGLRAFQTNGEFRIEATGDSTRSFRYGYVLLRLKSEKSAQEDRI